MRYHQQSQKRFVARRAMSAPATVTAMVTFALTLLFPVLPFLAHHQMIYTSRLVVTAEFFLTLHKVSQNKNIEKGPDENLVVLPRTCAIADYY